MDLFKNRVESFTRPKRAKGAANVKTNSKWPHPESFLATPDTLAEAGFYFDPSSEDKDSVSCYMCGKQLAEWAENDDPFEIHFKKCGKKCAWANVRCGLRTEMDPDGRFVFTDKNRLPASKAMEKCRLDTFLFGDGWIHDEQRNHGASSKKMAKAGFVYAPQEPNDDTAVCLYCGISLSGWDAEDDPTEEHRKRVKKSGNPCPMFPDIVFLSPPLKAKSHSRSKSKSSHVDVTIPLPTDDSDDDEFTRLGSVASSSTAKTPKPSRTVKKGAKTPGSRSTSKSQNIPIFDDNEAPEEVGQGRPTSRTRKTSTTTRARSISRTKSIASLVDSDAGTGTEDDMALTRSTRSRGKTKDTGRDADEESTAARKKGTQTRSKSKTRVSVIPENDSAEDEEPTPPPPKSTKKSLAKKPSTRKLAATKSSSSLKQKQYTEEEDVDNDFDAPPSLPPTKKSAAKSKPTPASVVAAAALFDDDDGGERMEVGESEPPTARPTRATRKSTRQPLTQSQEDMRPSTTKKRGTHSRTASTASRAGKSRAPSHVIEDAHSDDPLDMQMYIPPASISSVDPATEIEPGWDQKAEGSTAIERKPSKSKAREKPLPVPIQTDVPEQDVSNTNPPPIPPRSPSRPKSKAVLRYEAEPEEEEAEVGSEVASELELVTQKPEAERKTTPSDPKRDTRQSRSAAAASKPRSTRGNSSSSQSVANKSNPLLKSATMTRKGSFLGSRSSTQSQNQNAAAVLEISSDEGEEYEVESVVRAIEPTIVHTTKPKILTNARPPRVKAKDKEIATPAPVPAPAVLEHKKSSVSRSDNSTSKPNSKSDSMSRPASTVFQEGSVQAKIAQIEKTAETEQGSGGRISPFKPALTLTNGFHADLHHKDNDIYLDAVDVNANVNTQEIEDRDIQMAGPLDSVEEQEQRQSAEAQAKMETEVESEAQIEIPLSRPVVTPPRIQHRPASPFKTPFRLGTTPGNPFSVPPTPGVPMDLPVGVPIPLSKELFIPTRELSDAELSMTVEEWVRHHKQIEYEKFREDGERRIEAFLKHAEQTRRAIEGL